MKKIKKQFIIFMLTIFVLLGGFSEIIREVDNFISTNKEVSNITISDNIENDTPRSNISLSKQNALKKAKDYLEIMPFSYEGLIEQLEYEHYPHEDAVYAADNCGADWNEQAARKARDYIDMMAFSRERLIEQLEYEGFTHEQAVYGVTAVGY